MEVPLDSGSRSKRTCVRVREQIHRLREILEGDNAQASSPSAGRSKGRSQKRVGETDGGTSATKRSRRSGYR